MTGFDTLRLSREDDVVRLVLARAEARNALNERMCEELRKVFDNLDADPDVRCILVLAEGPVFCAGADLKERKGKDEAWIRQRRQKAFAAYDAIARCSKPVVAVIDGPVVGSGGEIAMSADFILASTRASFRFPEPQWGTVGATQRLQRVVGKRRAKELLFTGRIMPAEEALRLGLIARLVEPEALDELVTETAAQIAAAPALAIALTKRSVDLGEEMTLANGIRAEMAAIEHILATGDWKAGLDRFDASIGSSRADRTET